MTEYLIKTPSGDFRQGGSLDHAMVEKLGILAFRDRGMSTVALFAAGQWTSVRVIVDTPSGPE